MTNELRFPKQALFLLVLTLSGCDQYQDTKVRSYQNQPLMLKSADHKWLAINYWAIWCEPCREEIPELNDLAKGKSGIRVWGIDFDNPESLDALGRKIYSLGIEFPVVLPEDVPLLKLEMPQVLPATYLVAPDGRVRTQLLGPQTMSSIRAEVERLKAL